MRALVSLLLLGLVGCGTSVPGGNASADQNLSNADTVTPVPIAVQVGELGANFPACNAQGSTRHLVAGESLPVRSAPFANAPQIGAVPANARFFICDHSLDENWFGIVYDKGGVSTSCGVAEPSDTRRDYKGPCRSGWVQSAYVRLIGDEDQQSPAENQAAPQRRRMSASDIARSPIFQKFRAAARSFFDASFMPHDSSPCCSAAG